MLSIPSSIIHIANLLPEQDLPQIDFLLSQIPFEDGKNTASGAAREVKNNMQASREENAHKRHLQQLVFQAVAGHPLIQSAVMPKNILPPMISKYHDGMAYGWHTDSPVMTIDYTVRADLSMTLFLTAPESYEGGELVIHTPSGYVPYKLPKGDAIIYPTTRLHRVNPVTSGERIACVTWMQSLVKETEKRELLFQLKHVQEQIAAKDLQSEENLLLMQVYSNLMRMWTDL
ncbi:Fe2+-dependent dioxygenase [Taibaiella koreensis]|uniref:Fe2+-dependent dioxygenase n=1 Tax=Taibaiella koreensis TaxID=1268548 RepID=UPI000E5A039E|nr:Fe2+-dependent dioxygenase [Taibaiella koreensis]